MKRVCIAIDYNISAERIAEIGYNYAKAFNAEITIVHVLNDTIFYGIEEQTVFGHSTVNYEDEISFENQLRDDMEKYLEASKKHLKDATVQTKLLVGNTSEVILDFTKGWGADLLVIGKHKHNALENVLLGSTAMKIVRHATIPLLVISTRESH